MPCMYWVRVFCEDSPGAFAHQPLVKYPGRWVDLVDIGLSFLHGCRGVAGAGSGIGRGPGSLTLGRFSHALSPQLVGADRMGGLGVGLSPEARFPGDKLSIQGLKVCPSGADRSYLWSFEASLYNGIRYLSEKDPSISILK